MTTSVTPPPPMSDNPVVSRKPWEDPMMATSQPIGQPVNNQPYMDYYSSGSYYPPNLNYPLNPYNTIPSRPFLGGAFHDIAAGTNSVFDSLRMFTQGISSLAQFLDSTIYAGWSSVTALTTVVNNLKSFRSNYISQLISLIQRVLRFLLNALRVPGRACKGKIVIIATIATVLPILSRAITAIMSGAIYDVEVSLPYSIDEPGHLKASKGDRLKVLVSEKDWIYAERADGQRGCFPKTHVTTITTVAS